NHLQKCGFTPRAQSFKAAGQMVRNIDIEIPGTHPRKKNEILLLGAHYDSIDCPAANDNASGVAGLLEAATQSTGKSFQRTFPALWLPAPDSIEGPGMSDNWSFWQVGYPALMVTDTAFLRYAHYHKKSDLPANMNFDCMTRVVRGVLEATQDLAGRAR